jgi:hypothetical protein
MRAALAVLAATCLAAVSLHASQPQFWRLEGARDFLDGDTEGLSVDSEGRMRLSPASRLLHDAEAPYVWSLVQDEKGAVYAGTGNDGKVFKIEDGKARVFFDAAELEVHALALGPDDRLYVGTSPDGKVYAVDASGKSETFYDPADKYVWALVFDRSGNLFVATGAEGRIHRVDRKGDAQIVFNATDTHVTALAADASGRIYAGSSPSGVIYRVEPSMKVFVLLDSAYREVKALDTGADGSLYAALIDGKEREDTSRPPLLPPLPPTTSGTAEVTVTESFTIIPPVTATAPSPMPRATEPPRTGASKGAVLRILPSGDHDTLWSSADETPHSLARAGDGVLVGTGNKGKVYRVKDDRTWTMVAGFPAEQVTGIFRGARGAAVIASSNPGKVYALDAAAGSRGTFTSKAKDTETISSWGRLRWEASTPPGTEVQVQTRSGNTAMPDSTWSEWSAPYTHKEGDAITSERARFVQVRAVLIGKDGASPVLDAVSTAYLQRNLRPQVQSITVHPPGEVFQKPLSLTGEAEILGLEPGQGPEPRTSAAAAARAAGLPPATSYSRKLYQRGLQTFSWKADDPNGDTLNYDVHYRPVNDTRFRLLRKAVTDAVLAWDTSTVPNGKYIVRITASDSPSNPEALSLDGDKESAPFDVDNTPPTVSASLTQRSPARLRAVVKDDSSIVRKAEYSVDGARWEEVHPTDGINDSLEESYEIVPPQLSPGPHIVVVRASDLLGNVATARVEIP